MTGEGTPVKKIVSRCQNDQIEFLNMDEISIIKITLSIDDLSVDYVLK